MGTEAAQMRWERKAYKCGAGRHSSTHLKPKLNLHHLHHSLNLTMDIPIQYPWYRRVFPHRLTDLPFAEPLTDWPLMWPLSWSFPWMRPLLTRWFNWADNGHSEVKTTSYYFKELSSFQKVKLSHDKFATNTPTLFILKFVLYCVE